MLYRRLIHSLVQRKVPEFSCKVVQEGKILPTPLTSSSLLKDSSYSLLLFYPLDFTFVCPTELTAFADRIEEFRGEGCAVYGVSVDSEYSHLHWMKQPRREGGLLCPDRGFKLPLLSDLSKEMSRSFGVLNTAETVALRASVLLDSAGIVRHSSCNDLGIGRSVDEALRVLKAVKFVDESGGLAVCPANWTPGQQVINPQKSSEYFQKQK